jgi:hypothetical protein
MTTNHERVNRTPKEHVPNTSYSVVSINKPSSPLNQKVIVSPELKSRNYIPTTSRNDRAFDQTQRWTILAREAEADEVSILSVTSEEKGYYNSLLPDEPTVPTEPVEDNHTGSVISGFSEGEFVEHESEESVERFSEVNYDETIQFSDPSLPAPFTPTEPPPYYISQFLY